MSGVFRSAGVVVAVVAAMAVGRVITDQIPVGELATDPFVEEGSLGQPVELEYADVRVERVRSAPFIVPATDNDHVVRAGGVFLVVDLTLTVTTEPTTFTEKTLVDSDGQRYLESDRARCDASGLIPAGVPWTAMLCFDVPADRLRGMSLRVGRQGPDGIVEGTDRRDQVALIDLGIDADEAELLASRQDVAYRGFQGGFHESPDLEEVTVTSE